MEEAPTSDRSPAIKRKALIAWLNDLSGRTTFYNLHTDRFLRGVRAGSMLRDGLRVFEEATRYARRCDLDMVIVLCCELRSGRKVLGSPPRNLLAAEARALTPPLIYRFLPAREGEFWMHQFDPVATAPLDPGLFGLDDAHLTAWFMEAWFVDEFDASLHIRRSLYFRHGSKTKAAA